MSTASRDDVLRLFPGLQDHTVVEILAARATVSELEAVSLMLQDADEGLIGVKQRHGDRLSRLLSILSSSEIRLQDDPER